MTHHATGPHRILDQPRVYERFQRLLGARAARERIVREFLRPFDGARILDVGCGTGSFLDYLPASVEYVGYDLNSTYIESARRNYGDRGRFFCARVGEAQVLNEEPFDFVVAKSLLHHLNDEDVGELLTGAARVLRRGGIFFSLDPVRHPRQSVVTRLLMAFDRGRAIRTAEGYRALIAAHFSRIEERLVTDLLPIPFSHFVARASVE